MLSIAVYLYQQTVIISSVQSFKGYISGLSLEMAWGFWAHALLPFSRRACPHALTVDSGLVS